MHHVHLGINSDPTPQEEMGAQKVVDERRSRGALCSTTAQDIAEMLPLMLTGVVTPRPRTRLMCTVQSTHTETRLPPVLNDILIAHPVPAQVSRFRMTCFHDTKFYKHHEKFYDHRAAPADLKTASAPSSAPPNPAVTCISLVVGPAVSVYIYC